MYGSLREAVHQAEDIMHAQRSDKLMKDMLVLRRREKAFMLHNDTRYVDKLNQDIAVLRSDLKAAALSGNARDQIAAAIDRYEHDFKALVAAAQVKGRSNWRQSPILPTRTFHGNARRPNRLPRR